MGSSNSDFRLDENISVEYVCESPEYAIFPRTLSAKDATGGIVQSSNGGGNKNLETPKTDTIGSSDL